MCGNGGISFLFDENRKIHKTLDISRGEGSMGNEQGC